MTRTGEADWTMTRRG